MTKDYYYVACNDLKFLNDIRTLEHYNSIAIQSQQVSEKFLKSICEIVVPGEEYRRTHNLARLFQSIVEVIPDEPNGLNIMELSYLTDFYFDARYPGDDYVDVTKDTCKQCLDIMDKVVSWVVQFRSKRGLDTSDISVYTRDLSDIADSI